MTPGKPTQHGSGLAPDLGPGAMLLALTRIVSLWSSHEFQRSVVARSEVTLDPTAVRALYVLGLADGSATPGELAAALSLSKPATSQLLQRLTEATLVTRTLAPHDRRSAQIALTERGRAEFEALFAAGLSMIDTAVAQWSQEDRRALTRLLPRFLTELLTTPPQ